MPTSVNYVNSASEARVEGVNRAQNFERTFRIRDRCLEERRLIWSPLSSRISRAGVPGGRNYRLVILNGLAFDLHPVPERPARCLEEAETLRGLGPRVWIPLFPVMNAHIAAGQIISKLFDPAHQTARE